MLKPNGNMIYHPELKLYAVRKGKDWHFEDGVTWTMHEIDCIGRFRRMLYTNHGEEKGKEKYLEFLTRIHMLKKRLNAEVDVFLMLN